MTKKHTIALFIVYFILFMAITALIDYYAYNVISPIYLVAFSIVASAISTYFHRKSKIKTQADEVAKEIEEIL